MAIELIFSLGALILGGAGLMFALLIYRKPPRWLDPLTTRLEGIADSITDPQFIGKSIRAAYPPEEMSEYANAIVYDNIPTLAEHLGKEAVGALGSIYGGRAGSEMRKQSGTGKQYLALSGIGKQAVQMGGKDLLGGALGGLLEHPLAQPLIQQLLSGGLGGGGGGNSGHSSQPTNALPEWRPPM